MTYIERLKRHPGVQIAALFTAIGIASCLIDHNGFSITRSILLGILVSSPAWILVLVTAIKEYDGEAG